MGKNQQHKMRQMSRHGGGGGGGTDDKPGGSEFGDGMKDASFHTAEWHAARIAALTAERVPWEEWRAKQKEQEAKLEALAAEEERRQSKLAILRYVQCSAGGCDEDSPHRQNLQVLDEHSTPAGEYRAQLDADRARLLARGRNHKDLADKIKKDKKRKVLRF
jgi:hypothetical protein